MSQRNETLSEALSTCCIVHLPIECSRTTAGSRLSNRSMHQESLVQTRLGAPGMLRCWLSLPQPIEASVTLETVSYEGERCVVVEGALVIIYVVAERQSVNICVMSSSVNALVKLHFQWRHEH